MKTKGNIKNFTPAEKKTRFRFSDCKISRTQCPENKTFQRQGIREPQQPGFLHGIPGWVFPMF